jgi:hypothetical protein
LLRRRFAFAKMQIGRDGGVALRGEAASDLFGAGVPTGHVMDHHHAAVWTAPHGTRQIPINLIAFMAL